MKLKNPVYCINDCKQCGELHSQWSNDRKEDIGWGIEQHRADLAKLHNGHDYKLTFKRGIDASYVHSNNSSQQASEAQQED